MMYTTAPMNTNVGRERVDPDARDLRGGVAAHQLDPEPAEAVSRYIKREQPAVADLEPTVDVDEHRENQNVPQQFVQERRVDHLDQLTGRHSVECVE